MSELLKFSLTLESPELAKRVHGAAIQEAQRQQNLEAATPAGKALGALILSEPMRQWPELVQAAAAHGRVASQVILSEDRRSVYTHQVDDANIITAVRAAWAGLAAKMTPVENT